MFRQRDRQKGIRDLADRLVQPIPRGQRRTDRGPEMPVLTPRLPNGIANAIKDHEYKGTAKTGPQK